MKNLIWAIFTIDALMQTNSSYHVGSILSYYIGKRQYKMIFKHFSFEIYICQLRLAFLVTYTFGVYNIWIN